MTKFRIAKLKNDLYRVQHSLDGETWISSSNFHTLKAAAELEMDAIRTLCYFKQENEVVEIFDEDGLADG